MLISEFVEGGSLDSWIFNTYENDEEISDLTWKTIVFQIVYTLAVIQYHYKLMHNDCHYGNVLVDNTIQPGGYFVYTINNKKYYVPNNGFISKLWDWEFSMSYSNKIQDNYPNKYVICDFEYNRKLHKTIVDPTKVDDPNEFDLPVNYNEVYDLHYFLTTLLELYISEELFEWIMNLYPAEFILEETVSTETTKKTTSENTDKNSSESESTNESDNNESDNGESESTNSETESESTNSESESESEGTNSESSNSEEEMLYISKNGRLINDIEKEIDLPIPLTLLNDKFFECFTIKPEDFDEKTAVYFNAGF